MTTAVRTLRRATLEDLRAKIGAIDELLHTFPMRRARLAADIARPKAAVPGANRGLSRAGRPLVAPWRMVLRVKDVAVIGAYAKPVSVRGETA